MCGRYVKDITEHIANYHERLRDFLDALDANSQPQFNVAPSTTQAIRGADEESTFIANAKWGFVPFWSKNGKGYQINARSETVAEKLMFRQAFRQRRCVTWATGYYEWQTTNEGKQPYHIHFEDHRPFFFYGVWQMWKNQAGESITTFALMTTNPAEYLGFIHDRMPCIVEVDSPDVNHWLDHSDEDVESRHELLHPFEGEKLVATPVSTYVNSVRNQGAKCI